MGFRALNSVQGRTFTHKDILDEIMTFITKQPDGEKRAAVLKKGVCHALSIEWLRRWVTQHYNEGQLCNFNTEMLQNVATAIQVADNYYSYVQNWLRMHPKKADKPDERLILDDERNGVIMNSIELSQEYITLCSKDQMKNVAAYKLDDGNDLATVFQGPYFLLSVQWDESAHAVAGGVRSNGNGIILYDPNNNEVQHMDSIADVPAYINVAYFAKWGPVKAYSVCEVQ